jgi:hypothetical protein
LGVLYPESYDGEESPLGCRYQCGTFLPEIGIDKFRIRKIMEMRHKRYFITPPRDSVLKRIYPLNWRNGGA